MYRKLAGDRPGTFLLESAENGRSWSRWSFVGARSAAALTERRRAADLDRRRRPPALPSGGDPLDALRDVVEELHSEPLPGLPPLTGGLVGYLGYDWCAGWSGCPTLAVDDLRLPELVMLLATDLAAVDHHEGTVTLIANAVNWNASDERVDEAYDDAVARLDGMTAALAAPAPVDGGASTSPAEPRFTRRRTPAEYHAAVEAAEGEIEAGEAFQVVVVAAVRDGRRRRPARRLPGAAGDQPEPVHVPAARARVAAGGPASTSSAPARRRWSPSTTARRPRTRSPAPAGAAPPRRRTSCWRRTCSRTRRSAPST